MAIPVVFSLRKSDGAYPKAEIRQGGRLKNENSQGHDSVPCPTSLLTFLKNGLRSCQRYPAVLLAVENLPSFVHPGFQQCTEEDVGKSAALTISVSLELVLITTLCWGCTENSTQYSVSADV